MSGNSEKVVQENENQEDSLPRCPRCGCDKWCITGTFYLDIILEIDEDILYRWTSDDMEDSGDYTPWRCYDCNEPAPMNFLDGLNHAYDGAEWIG